MKPLRSGLLIAAFVLILDQFTKYLMLSYFAGAAAGGGPIYLPEVIYGLCLDPAALPEIFHPDNHLAVLPVLNLVAVCNFGMSFGMLNDYGMAVTWVLIALALVICGALLVWLKRAETRLQIVALAMVIGGALGNVLDRLIFGAVFDFIDVHAFGMHWPAFNIADSCIVIGVVVLVFESFLLADRQKSATTPPEKTEL